MAQSLAPPRQRKHAAASARHGSVNPAVFTSAGVHFLRSDGAGIDDPSNLLEIFGTSCTRPSLRDVLRQLEPSGRSALITGLRRAKAGEGASFELKIPAGEDSPRWFRVSLGFAAGGSRWDAVLVDISGEHENIESLQSQESHLRNIVEYNPQLPWIADASGQIIDFTDRWLQSTGMSRQEAFGKGWLGSTHPEDIERVSTTVTRCLAAASLPVPLACLRTGLPHPLMPFRTRVTRSA